MSSPAPVRSTKARATSATTNALRKALLEEPELMPRAPSLMESAKSLRVALKRRHNPEEDAGEQRQSEDEEQHPGVHHDLDIGRQRSLGHGRLQGREPEVGHDDPQGAPSQG